jgi:cobalt/nickel transport system permease protein
MHIAEGYLPLGHALGWTLAAAPFVAHGAAVVRRRLRDSPGCPWPRPAGSASSCPP